MSLPLTLQEVKLFLRVDVADEDSYINLLILLASEMCRNYMRKDIPDECPESIRQACLIIIGYFYENRGESLTGNGKEPIPQVVYRLLDPYREDGF